MEHDPLLKPQELAAWLGTSAGSLAQMRYRGQGPRFVKTGKLVRYRRSDIDAWLDANTRQQTSAA